MFPYGAHLGSSSANGRVVASMATVSNAQGIIILIIISPLWREVTGTVVLERGRQNGGYMCKLIHM